jgi:hypothetical protein
VLCVIGYILPQTLGKVKKYIVPYEFIQILRINFKCAKGGNLFVVRFPPLNIIKFK